MLKKLNYFLSLDFCSFCVLVKRKKKVVGKGFKNKEESLYRGTTKKSGQNMTFLMNHIGVQRLSVSNCGRTTIVA